MEQKFYFSWECFCLEYPSDPNFDHSEWFLRDDLMEKQYEEHEICWPHKDLRDTQEQFCWVDHSHFKWRPKNQNLLGVIFSYEEAFSSKANFCQKFVLLQPGKTKFVKFTVIVWSEFLKDRPQPSAKGQIVYFRNCFQINTDLNNQTFLINTKFPEWRGLLFNWEEKIIENNSFCKDNFLLFDPNTSIMGKSNF